MAFLKNFGKDGFCACLNPSCDHQPGSPPERVNTNSRLSRRNMLRLTMAGAVAGLATEFDIENGAPRHANAQSTLSPDAAIQQLVDGNKRFAEGHLTSFNEDLGLLKQKTAEKQEPFAAVLSCADSRVPVELIFDQSIGHIFAPRVAGNIATTEMIASLEYGAAVLGTKAIVVMGHSNCGAVKATIDNKEVPGQISALYRYIRPAVDQAGSNMDAATKANAKIQATLLRTASPVIAGLIKQNKLKVVAAHYDVANGKMTLLD